MLALTNGESAWGLAEQLAAVQADALHGANWQRSGGKGQKPKPIPRPGAGPKTEKFGTGRSRDELDELLARVGHQRPEGVNGGDQPR